MKERVFVSEMCPYCEYEHDVLLIEFVEEDARQTIVFQCMADGFEFEKHIHTRRQKKFVPPPGFGEMKYDSDYQW